MRISKVKEKLRRNEPALITCLHLMDASIYELAGLMGFDGIWMDLEHHGNSMAKAMEMMRAARVGGSDILCRPAKGEFMRMGRMLEAGAHGIMYPRCGDAEEARQVVQWSKFAPLGQRGFDGGNPDMPYCAMDIAEYVKMANEQTWVAIQLEDQHAVDRAEEIAAVEGVDILFFGPADYSILSGIPGQFNHPRIQKSIETIARAARNQGKHWGLPVGDAQKARQHLELGARLICYGADIVWVKAAMEKIQSEMKALGFSFNNTLAR